MPEQSAAWRIKKKKSDKNDKNFLTEQQIVTVNTEIYTS